jgi:hypothetical protein
MMERNLKTGDEERKKKNQKKKKKIRRMGKRLANENVSEIKRESL